MPTRRALKGVAHDIAHHAMSGLSFLSPHMAQALRASGLESAIVELLDASPYPLGVVESEPLRWSLRSLHRTAKSILVKYGFSPQDVKSISLNVAAPPFDESGHWLLVRVVITGIDDRQYRAKFYEILWTRVRARYRIA